MGCCIVLITLLSSWWGFRRKFRRFFGMTPDPEDWETPSERIPFKDRVRALCRSRIVRTMIGIFLVSVFTYFGLTFSGNTSLLNEKMESIRRVTSILVMRLAPDWQPIYARLVMR